MSVYGTDYFIIESKNNILPKSDLYKVYKDAKKVMKINGINVMFMEDGIDYKSEEKTIKQLISEEDWISSIDGIVNDESNTEILYKNASNKQYYVEYYTEDECTYYVSFKCNNKDSKSYGKNIVIMTKRLESIKSVWIESAFFNEAVTETKYGYDAGVSVKGKNIIVAIYKGEPTKEEVESKIDMFKANAKLISKNWNTIMDEAAKKHKEYIDNCYEGRKDNKEYIKMLDKYNTIEKAKKGLIYDSISYNGYTERLNISTYTVLFDSEVMDKDMHSMSVEVNVYNDKNTIKVPYVTIEG